MRYGSKILHNKFQAISSKNEGVTTIFAIFNFYLFFFQGLDIVLCISSEIMDGFWCSRCLNNCIDLPNMIESFVSGATASLVPKKGTENLSLLFENIFWCSRYLNNCIHVPDMMGSFIGGTTTPLVVKSWTKDPWLKIPTTLIAISPYLEAKFDYGYFIIFCALWF